MADELENKEEQEFQRKFQSLPEDVKLAFSSEAVTESIVEIGKKHGLLIDKIGELGDETGLVMLGITRPSDYIKNITALLEVDPVKAREIAEDINQKVFQPIKESLKKIHGLAPLEASPRRSVDTAAKPSLGGPLTGSPASQPEIIRPAGAKIAIKSEREEMGKIETSESIPGMEIKKPEAPASKVFAKPIEIPKAEPPKQQPPPAPPSTSNILKRLTPIDELLDKIDGAALKPPNVIRNS